METEMGSKYVFIVTVAALGPVLRYSLLLFIFPKCSVMSTCYFYKEKKHKHFIF